jgi:hypothetical protein
MTDENLRRESDAEGRRDHDNSVFKRAIDKVFKDAASRRRKPRKREDDAKDRQGPRKHGQ